jgi:hypothetical protein
MKWVSHHVCWGMEAPSSVGPECPCYAGPLQSATASWGWNGWAGRMGPQS